MQRADDLYVEICDLFERSLHLRTVFADDIGVIATRFVDKRVVKVQLVGKQRTIERVEGAESIGGEEYFVGLVVGEHDLRPVHHRRHDKLKLMLAGGERIVFLHDDRAIEHVLIKKLADHLAGFSGADDLGVRITAE